MPWKDPTRLATWRAEHYEDRLGYNREWRKKNPEKCRLHELTKRERHGDRLRARSRDYYQRVLKERLAFKWQELRAELIAAYGSCCACCGELEPRFLTLEHINRDGADHRKRVGGWGSKIYMDLKKRNWPKEGLTLLCWNCNVSTRYGDPCPHTLTAGLGVLGIRLRQDKKS